MLVRPFDCPTTRKSCRDSSCTVMHCAVHMMRMRTTRLPEIKEAPYQLTRALIDAGYVLHTPAPGIDIMPEGIGDDDNVEIILREAGGTRRPYEANTLRWSHHEAEWNEPSDIMAYRVVRGASATQTVVTTSWTTTSDVTTSASTTSDFYTIISS